PPCRRRGAGLGMAVPAAVPRTRERRAAPPLTPRRKTGLRLVPTAAVGRPPARSPAGPRIPLVTAAGSRSFRRSPSCRTRGAAAIPALPPVTARQIPGVRPEGPPTAARRTEEAAPPAAATRSRRDGCKFRREDDSERIKRRVCWADIKEKEKRPGGRTFPE